MRVEYEVLRWSEAYAPNAALLRLALTNEGFTVFQWCDQPDRCYAQHSHPTDQTHWVISGSLELTVENYGTVVLEAGDRDLMPAGTYHSARVIGDEPVLYLIGEKRS